MPEGSSSAAPVMSPGPRSAKNLGKKPRRWGGVGLSFTGYRLKIAFAKMALAKIALAKKALAKKH